MQFSPTVTLTKFITSVIERISQNLRRVIPNSLEKTAKFIEKEAKLRAPVDTGALEDDIRVKIVGKKSVEIINSIKSDKGFPYGAYLHETKGWKLGPKSVIKNNSQIPRVGPKWMVRAYTENVGDIKKGLITNFRVKFLD